MSHNKQPIVYLTRRECFSAAHSLSNKTFSLQENQECFGKCINCHGHNYIVEVTVKGAVNPSTGMVINITILKKYIQDILDKLDHKNLNIDVDYFNNVISTTENLTVYIWNELEKMLGNQCSLHEIKIFETDKNICIYRGESS